MLYWRYQRTLNKRGGDLSPWIDGDCAYERVYVLWTTN
jgi:hypothetical protein